MLALENDASAAIRSSRCAMCCALCSGAGLEMLDDTDVSAHPLLAFGCSMTDSWYSSCWSWRVVCVAVRLAGCGRGGAVLRTGHPRRAQVPLLLLGLPPILTLPSLTRASGWLVSTHTAHRRLRKGSRQCVLVGDPRQLPATVFIHQVTTAASLPCPRSCLWAAVRMCS